MLNKKKNMGKDIQGKRAEKETAFMKQSLEKPWVRVSEIDSGEEIDLQK